MGNRIATTTPKDCLRSAYQPELDPSRVFQASSGSDAADWGRAQTHILAPRFAEIGYPIDEEILTGCAAILGAAAFRLWEDGSPITLDSLTEQAEELMRCLAREEAP